MSRLGTGSLMLLAVAAVAATATPAAAQVYKRTAADGTTYQEALANVEVVIREWIETARDLGRPIPEPEDD